MERSNNPIIIVGAGMVGLFAALLVKKRRPEAQVIVVERSAEAGGNFRGVNLEGFGYCDRAMRLLYETGIPEFDEMLHGILPKGEWHILPDNIKDVVGVYWRGGLQTHSPYIDLRRLPDETHRQCEQEILHQVRTNGHTLNLTEDAATALQHRFGSTTASLWEDVLKKLYQLPPSQLHETATAQPAMNRVILYGEEQMHPVLADDKMRAVIAWPDQLTLPVKRQPAQNGLYPRKFGMTGVIDRAVEQAKKLGVQFLFKRSVAALEVKDTRIASVKLDDGTTIENPSLVISANGLHASLNMLQADGKASSPPFSPPKSWMVFLRSEEPAKMGNIYDFWCFDGKYDTFRVTNYANYCPDAGNENGFPLCVEVWSKDTDASQATERALRELREMNVLNGGRITGQAAIQTQNLHAMCTLENVRHLRTARDELKNVSPENMITVGPFVDEGVLLLYEVSRKMHALVDRRL
jgi:2-polyprenyl-6-methoxyphenol hydroxylase-like FAD-dependent oxidoreductase